MTFATLSLSRLGTKDEGVFRNPDGRLQAWRRFIVRRAKAIGRKPVTRDCWSHPDCFRLANWHVAKGRHEAAVALAKADLAARKILRADIVRL